MKKAEPSRRATLRRAYKRADFPNGLVRGKYASRVATGTNVVRLEPEIAAAFPTSKVVNKALGNVLRAARAARLTRRSSGRDRHKSPNSREG